ncbi:hypothetical protein ACFYN0_29435 [Streptomyces sp. NPDC006704]|uniref:hypothetical protein n=1 Tax=Streptomyces sp. NPDC006704 TaxID=3364760 RepID=UPI0036939F1D
MTDVVRAVRAGVLVGCVLMVAAGCGGASGADASRPPTPPSRAPVPPADRGPECEGAPAADGLHVLRGGSAELPGGAGWVLYKEGGSDGTHRTATLTNGTGTGAASASTASWPVRPGQSLTVSGRAFTVSQICAYRVVLTPQDKAAPAPPPASPAADPDWPTLTDGRLRLRFHVPDTDEHGAISAVLEDIAAGPDRADIAVMTRAGGGAAYPDARVGDTLEFAGRLWKLTVIDPGVGEPSEANPRSGHVDLQLIGPSR